LPFIPADALAPIATPQAARDPESVRRVARVGGRDARWPITVLSGHLRRD
jgi:hypothetical protein